jgi:hypothetical protein
MVESAKLIDRDDLVNMLQIFEDMVLEMAPNITAYVEDRLAPTRARRAFAEEALKMARDRRNRDKVINSLVTALEKLLDFDQDDRPDASQIDLDIDDVRVGAEWRAAMRTAIELVDLKCKELKLEEIPIKVESKAQSALAQVAAALHAAHDEGVDFKLPYKLGRHKLKTPKPPAPKRLPKTMNEGLLAALPADGKPISRAEVVSQMIIGNFAANKKSASRAFRELIKSGKITEQGVRGRKMVALRL